MHRQVEVADEAGRAEAVRHARGRSGQSAEQHSGEAEAAEEPRRGGAPAESARADGGREEAQRGGGAQASRRSKVRHISRVHLKLSHKYEDTVYRSN